MEWKNKYVGYIGTYTKGDSKGIYRFTLNMEKEQLEDIQLVAELGNPTYVTISQDNRYLYSVIKDENFGGVAAYAINPNHYHLTEINRQLVEGPSPCHVSVDSKNSVVVSANYHAGTITTYETKPDGSILPAKSHIQHVGKGPNAIRQEKPHAHFSGYTPDEQYIVAIDLGIDKVITYHLVDGVLTEAHSLAVRPGSGPRHITFHPNGKFAYVMTELSNEVIVLKYHGNGQFTEIQYIATIPADYTDNSQGSAIQMTKDGKFVYAANRGHNSITVFRAEDQTGELQLVEHVSSEGDWPRDFTLDPTERYIIGSNEQSGNLVLYKRNNESGKLSVIQSNLKVPYPVCVKFLHGGAY
ncbi:lactonase family protein [Bacillus kwashiorkori]|uniref:lactonase family protein n=1 Tax=Bacillus kwashiorkori TaxID=1522318 RepID=UPI0007829878|nr:lactonase family protein [Bacillus kwashiorkori]